jgi:hypothetical protein
MSYQALSDPGDSLLSEQSPLLRENRDFVGKEPPEFLKKTVKITVGRLVLISSFILVAIVLLTLNIHSSYDLMSSSKPKEDVSPCKTSCSRDKQCSSYTVR